MNQLQRSDFYYDLPNELIAQQPLENRVSCRLMVMGKESLEHRVFSELPDFIEPGTVMILNDTKVIPARIPILRKSGGAGEMLIQGVDGDGQLLALGRPSKRLKLGERVICEKNPSVELEMVEKGDGGMWKLIFVGESLWPNRMNEVGELPLPPYIQREEGPDGKDEEGYQTVFAKQPGSAAAPTASLHFDEPLLEEIRKQGVEVLTLTHHVGTGTFLPVREDEVSRHQMHTESFVIPEEVGVAITKAKSEGRPVLAVGTTVARALESASSDLLSGKGAQGDTEIFIYPPYQFKVVDRLMTNFHLPESTLLMMVSALMGRERMLEAYGEAIKEGYRFFSYGDAMLLDPAGQSSSS